MKQRQPKVHYLYAELNKDRMTSTSIVALTEVLKEHQLALDVAEQLLQMGVSGLEVNSLCVDATHMPQCEWLANWIEAHAFLANHNYKAALSIFKRIKTDSPIQNHHRMLVQIGKCYFYDGSYDLALRYLERANAECPQMCGEGLIILANLLCREGRYQDLDRLAGAPTLRVSDYRPEHWFILALRLFYAERYERVDYFLEKCRGKSKFLDIEVALLKATVYISFQKYDSALMELRGIMKVAEHRFELYKKYVEIYIAKGKAKDAEFYSSLARQALGKTPRTLMLLATAQEVDPSQHAQLKPLLYRIHKLDENYTPAIEMLVKYLVKEKNYHEAGRLLRQQLAVQPTANMASTMADICTVLGEHSNALSYYNMALRLDPNHQKAINALNTMSVEGKRGGGGSGDSGIRNCGGPEKMSTGDVPFEVVDLIGADVSVGTNHTDQSSGFVPNETLWDDAEEMSHTT